MTPEPGDPQRIRTLDYPNHEVRLALHEELLAAVSGEQGEDREPGQQWVALLEAHDFDGFADDLKAFLAGMPYQWQERDTPHFEGYDAMLLYAGFHTEDFDIRAEESTRRGRSDLLLIRAGRVFVLACKVAPNEAAGAKKLHEAMDPMRRKG